jgi:hypothetical protein
MFSIVNLFSTLSTVALLYHHRNFSYQVWSHGIHHDSIGDHLWPPSSLDPAAGRALGLLAMAMTLSDACLRCVKLISDVPTHILLISAGVTLLGLIVFVRLAAIALAFALRNITHIVTRCIYSSLLSLQFLGGLFRERRNFGHYQRTVQSRNRKRCHVGWTLGRIRNTWADGRPSWKWREQSSSCPSSSQLIMKRSAWPGC